MIYASLNTIRAWHDRIVPPVYVVLALATGGILYFGLASLFSDVNQGAVWAALLAILAGWMLKALYWSRLDGRTLSRSTADAIGLPKLENVRPIEAPHSQANFVMREMGFAVARNHADRIRRYAVFALFIVPALCCLALLALPAGLAPLFGMIAVLSASAGILAERWLFFAEAQHVVTLYYGAKTA
jgi:DMSO reductase anchor subunit